MRGRTCGAGAARRDPARRRRVFTHGHADHILGIDELRRYNALQRGAMPCYGDADAARHRAHVRLRLRSATPRGGGLPQLDLIGSTGRSPSAGSRSCRCRSFTAAAHPGAAPGRFAYLTDCSRIPDESWRLLDGLDVVVLDALRERPHPTHFTIDEAVEAARRIGAPRTYFTHMCHDLGHAATNARLPPGMELAYDGLVLDSMTRWTDVDDPMTRWTDGPMDRWTDGPSDDPMTDDADRPFPRRSPPRWHAPVLALGNFDGLHRGHMKIIDRVRRRAGSAAARRPR
jgi:phosphoribosyl 1,2-cyclic phosphate phosphodiesterase